MGVLKDLYGATLLSRVPEGCCQECAVQHEPQMPHNKDSMYYQYHFYDEHGRFPTWEDAMAHCPVEIRTYFIEELKKRGVPLG